ncbi:hypothetical protein GCM10023187_29120 [Nibrella viscosa]|uniref:Uncharacterized protein n=2 Tax=Nibrella viscosa TaxID=1084524 RepID=A0ABP8KIM1_9BACT
MPGLTLGQMTVADTLEQSTVVTRLGYANRTLFAGRDFGINQYMITPGITYYHKSGINVDVTGYYFSQSQPLYELTALSVGYMHNVSDNLLLSVDLSRSFYTQTDAEFPALFPYNAYLSGSYDWGNWMAGLDYTFLFGNETAHRVRPRISYYMSWKNVGIFDRISLNPTLSATFGGDQISFEQLRPVSMLTDDNPRLQAIANNSKQKANGNANSGKGNGKSKGSGPVAQPPVPPANNAIAQQSYFGLMCYTLSVPLRFTLGTVRVGTMYNLVFPVKLYPTESISTNPVSYFGLSLSHTLTLR